MSNGHTIISKSTLIPVSIVIVIIAGVWAVAAERTSVLNSVANNTNSVKQINEAMTAQTEDISDIKGSIIRIETHLRMNGHAHPTDP